MKVMRTLVLGLGILLGCGCGRKVTANVRGDFPHTTEGTYMGNGSTYKGKAMNRYGYGRNARTLERPGQGYYAGEHNYTW